MSGCSGFRSMGRMNERPCNDPTVDVRVALLHCAPNLRRWEFALACLPVRFCADHWLAAARVFAEGWAKELKAQADEREAARTAKPPKVYVARRRRDGLIKIGFSRNVPSRMRQLADGHGDMEVLVTLDGDERAERALHARFAQHRAERREWFHPDPEILSWVDMVARRRAA